MLGVAQWRAKGNQMGPGFGPELKPLSMVPAVAGCWRIKGCKSDNMGVVHRTAHHCRTAPVWIGSADWKPKAMPVIAFQKSLIIFKLWFSILYKWLILCIFHVVFNFLNNFSLKKKCNSDQTDKLMINSTQSGSLLSLISNLQNVIVVHAKIIL